MDDVWSALRLHTAARIALGRCGAGLPTAQWLSFGVAHAQARDAVHLAFEVDALASSVEALGFATLQVYSAATDRAVYLRRPDLGRRLSDDSAAVVDAQGPAEARLVIVVADGLSATAVHAQAAALLTELKPLLEDASFAIGPVVLARQARVALGDDIGERLGAQAVLMLIGERPGLSSPDSLGAYITWAPRRGLNDAARNCVSNIRPQGLPPLQAARIIAWLLQAARRMGVTGIGLKDDSADALAAPSTPAVLMDPASA